ncbi:hypothetical protein [Rhizobium sp. L1K21]|uniref:hypothetical protein n=1 Tax=Rhizobium sp. L1K21 TaxID=2954933 RepID=UPI002092BC23|nr:hypothetical protein [Rhizobium sp. L1K21]MCO6187484.1 hypothetical protein [Rhizobium sp. L1K21]
MVKFSFSIERALFRAVRLIFVVFISWLASATVGLALDLQRQGQTIAVPLTLPDGMEISGNAIDKTLALGNLRVALRLLQDPTSDCQPLVEARFKSREKDGFRFRLTGGPSNWEKDCRLAVRNHEKGEDINSRYLYLEPCDCYAALHAYYPTAERTKAVTWLAPILTSLEDYAYNRTASSFEPPAPANFSDPKIELHTAVFNTLDRMDNGGPLECNMTFRGQIEDGDAERIAKAYHALSQSTLYRLYANMLGHDQIVLCLESPGGSFVEALNFVKARLAISTMVKADASCLSACSIMFMAGLGSYPGEGVAVHRFLEPGGRLGFHTPSLEVPGGDYQSEHVNRAYRVAIRSIYEILHLLTVSADKEEGDMGDVQDENRFPASLLMNMLKTPSDEMFYVDTIGKAGRWDIELNTRRPLGLDENALSEGHFQWACANLLEWGNGEERNYDLDRGEPGYENMITGPSAHGNPPPREKGGIVRIYEPGFDDYECIFQREEDNIHASSFHASNHTIWTAQADYGSVGDHSPTYYNLYLTVFLDPETPLEVLR